MSTARCFASVTGAGRLPRLARQSTVAVKARGDNRESPKKEVYNDGEIPAQQFQLRTSKDSTVPITLGFTKQNELNVGRIAMLGFSAAIVGETITGKGICEQVSLETGIPVYGAYAIVVCIIVFNLFAALLPTKGKMVLPENELKDAPTGSLQEPGISVTEPKKFFQITNFGFSKENELFVGRVAQLGFAAALVGELVTGRGPMGQLGLETGIPFWQAKAWVIGITLFFTLASIGVLGNGGKWKTDDDQ